MVTYVLDDHDQEGELDGKGLLGVEGACDEVGAHVGAHDLEHGRGDVGVCDTLDVTVADVLVPNLKGLRSIHTWVSKCTLDRDGKKCRSEVCRTYPIE